MSDIKRLIKDIDRGVGLEKNIPVYHNILADTYLNYAAVELTFSACLLWETVAEAEGLGKTERACYEKAMKLLADAVDRSSEQMRSLAENAGQLRDEITAVMDVYTSYTDRLINYSYVLERMPYCLEDETDFLEDLKVLDEDDLLHRLMYFVGGQGDASIQKERLQRLVGMIPVQMTKNKFLEKIESTLTLYKGSDRESLDTFVYMIRSAAMLHQPEACSVCADGIEEYIHELEQTDFAALDKERYEELREKLEIYSKEVLSITDFYYSLQKVVNGIYALVLAVCHGNGEQGVCEECMKICREVAGGNYDEESLVPLEGRIEGYVEKASYLEAVLFEVRNSCQDVLSELGLTEAFEDFALIANLLSDSLFIDLEKKADEMLVDDAMLKKVTAELTQDLSELFGSLQKPVKRAVMASVLEKLPTEFQTVDEIMTYIRTNLFGCRNMAEKAAALLELGEWMEDEMV